jgi:hypothetical protein
VGNFRMLVDDLSYLSSAIVQCRRRAVVVVRGGSDAAVAVGGRRRPSSRRPRIGTMPSPPEPRAAWPS